jgi:NAD(P)-dependent dehydrogenase (short-subunit alcohol dehydrogenase family)
LASGDTSLKNKVAIVTGGSRGIGEAITVAFAQSGATVVIADVLSCDNVLRKLQNMTRRCLAVRTDVTSFESVQDMVRKTLDEFGKIDVLVNNAGVVRIGLVEDFSVEEWDRIMDVNAKGVFLCCKSVIPHMKSQRSGKIINISSSSGRSGWARYGAYCASKFAIVGFTQALAKEVAEYNITANTVCPGIIYTDMWKYLSEQFGNLRSMTPQASFDALVQENIPLRKPQTSEDIARAVHFLASSEADSITGIALDVSGGQIMR